MTEVPKSGSKEVLSPNLNSLNGAHQQTIIVAMAETDHQIIDTLKKIVDGKTGNSDLVDSAIF